MLLVTHVLIALSSIIYTFYLLFVPSDRGVRLASWLVGLTLISGTALVISLRASLLRSCMTGLAYLLVTTAGIVVVRRKLSRSIDS
jgi:hypothetical protein